MMFIIIRLLLVKRSFVNFYFVVFCFCMFLSIRNISNEKKEFSWNLLYLIYCVNNVGFFW